MESNIIAGLISGLTVTFIVLVLNKIWSNIVEPWFEERVYKDLHVEGKWFSLYVNSVHFRQEAINLKRAGHKVTGNMMCKCGPDDGEEYTLDGSFRNLLLPMTYESKDKAKTDRGTITLRAVHNGERLIGRVSLYNTKRETISSAFVIWFRSKSDLEEQVEYIKSHREELEKIREKSDAAAEELKEFFEKYYDEFLREKDKQKENTIEGSVERIEEKS